MGREAHNAYARAWYHRHAEQIKIQKKGWKSATTIGRKAARIKRYGITLLEFGEMLAAQDGRCAACGVRLELYIRAANAAAIDHDHSTNKVRGVLCMRCNSALGFLDDDALKIVGLLRYREKF